MPAPIAAMAHWIEAPHRRGRRKAEVGNAEIGDEVLGHRAALAIGNHAIDVGRLEARILDRAQRRLKLEGQRCAIGATHVLGLADAGDGCYFAQGHGCTPRTAATQVMGFAVALPILRRARCQIVVDRRMGRATAKPIFAALPLPAVFASYTASQPQRSRAVRICSGTGATAATGGSRSSVMPRANRCSRPAPPP